MSVKLLRLWPRQVLVPRPSSKQRCHVSNVGGVGPLVRRFPSKLWDRPSLLQRCRSCESSLSTSKFMMRRTFPARLFSFSGEDSDDHDSSDTDSFSDDESSDEIDSDGGFNPLNLNHRTILPDGGAQLSEQEERMKQRREETSLWRSSVEEAREMDGGGLVNREPGNDSFYRFGLKLNRTMIMKIACQQYLPLLLANYAQFLCLVARDYDRYTHQPYEQHSDYDRAEEYFERAVIVKEEDAIRETQRLS